MPHVDPLPSFSVTLTGKELRLVLLGLIGALKDGEDKAAAAKLNFQICYQRANFLKQFSEKSTADMENSKKHLSPEDRND